MAKKNVLSGLLGFLSLPKKRAPRKPKLLGWKWPSASLKRAVRLNKARARMKKAKAAAGGAVAGGSLGGFGDLACDRGFDALWDWLGLPSLSPWP